MRKAFGFTDRHRPFQATGTEAAGYGCGWLLMVPLRFALCFAPIFIPVLWYQAVHEWYHEGRRDFFPVSMVWVAAATGIVSWLCVRPLLGITRWPISERVKRKAPLLMLIALVLWGGMLFLVAGASRSWPTRGVASRLTLTSSRPPVGESGMASSEAELNALFQRIVEAEFVGEMAAVLGASEVDASFPNQHWSPDDRDKPLRKTWRVAVAGTSRAALNTRLMAVAEELTAALPENVRSTINVALQPDLMTMSFWRLDLYREENLFLLAAIMTLGGWFAGMTRGRPLIHAAAPVLLIAGAAGLHLVPFSRLSSGMITPAGERQPANPMEGKAMELFVAKAQSDPEAAALYNWIVACRRLDRAAAEALSNRPLDNNTWERTAGMWLRFEPLVIVKETLRSA